jgi:hypothetical protein
MTREIPFDELLLKRALNLISLISLLLPPSFDFMLPFLFVLPFLTVPLANPLPSASFAVSSDITACGLPRAKLKHQ